MDINEAIKNMASPFSTGDLISTAVSLLAWVGLFILLSMSFTVVPLLIGAIKDSFEHNYRSEFSKEYNRVHLMKFGMSQKELRKHNRAAFRYGVKMHYRRRKRERDED